MKPVEIQGAVHNFRFCRVKRLGVLQLPLVVMLIPNRTQVMSE